MLDQSFNARNLLLLTTRADPRRYRLGRKRSDYINALEKIAKNITDDAYSFSSFKRGSVHKRPVYSASNAEDEYCLRKLSDNLRRAFNVRPANRDDIVNQSALLMREQVPFHLVKLDVKSFYESLDRRLILEQICIGSELSFRSKYLLRLLLASDKYFPDTGLPRGLSLSSTLSELAMRPFDDAARNIAGVYYYARFVDDIIIFSHKDPSAALEELAANLSSVPGAPKLNKEKIGIYEFDGKGTCINSSSGEMEMSYLGYRFIFNQKPSQDAKNKITIKIAEKKLAKIRRRAILALLDGVRTRDISLLLDRLRFLTGNYILPSSKGNATLRGGIYYNYKLIDPAGVEELGQLSTFLHSAISAKRGQFGRKVSSLGVAGDSRFKLCFATGYTRQITHKFDAQRLHQIKDCWKNA